MNTKDKKRVLKFINEIYNEITYKLGKNTASNYFMDEDGRIIKDGISDKEWDFLTGGDAISWLSDVKRNR